ncbi:hypothetical protein MD484_g9068, partial [Candolleomyces efflorescens]
MSSTVENPLNVFTVQTWKRICINKALELNAYEILMGEETQPAVSDMKARSSFNERRSKLIGYIRSTLDHSQTTTVIGDLGTLDAPGIWKRLLEAYEPKTAGGRISVLQELITLRKGDSDHENESYTDFGTRAISLASRLASLLPTGPEYTKEQTESGTVGSGQTAATREILSSPSKFTKGYSAYDLAMDLAIAMIPIGLGKDDTMLQHTLNHLGADLDGKTALEHLRKADTMNRNSQLAEGTSATALLAAQKKKYFQCEIHGKYTTHASKDCCVLKGSGKQKQKAQVAEKKEEILTPEEKVIIAQVAHIASPPIRRTNGSKANTSWNTDSGATSHMTPHRHWIRNYVHCRVAVLLANNHVVWAKGKGDVFFNPTINGQPSETVTFKDVLYVPALQNNLFSILSAVRKNKMRVVIEGESLDFQKDGNTILTATIHQNTGLLDGTTLNNQEHAYITQRVSKDLLHQRLGHIGRKRINQLIEGELGTGIVVRHNTDIPDTCEHCIAGKQHRNPFPNLSEHRSTEIIGRIHSDLHGPLTRTPSGFKYWITFIDDHSRFKEVHLLKSKDEASRHFKEYIAKVERQTGRLVKEIRDDKGGEYMSNEFISCKMELVNA